VKTAIYLSCTVMPSSNIMVGSEFSWKHFRAWS